jgi:orotidine-5'-phosphate decarboxylase
MRPPTASRLCVALDAPDALTCLALADAVAPSVGALKVGLTAFAAGGPDLVRAVGTRAPVFLDLKWHDIPAQVGGASRAAATLGVEWATVHASGGADMVRAAVDAAGGEATILAVTVLTSLDRAALHSTGVPGAVADQVTRLAELALSAGAGGLVCSPQELGSLREAFGSRAQGGPLLVAPGIRPAGSAADDQRRTASVREAIERGADLVVVGRPITHAPDPGAEAARLGREDAVKGAAGKAPA